MYNRRIHTIMAKRYTKRAYKKRRTLRKLRVKHRNTQRGGLGIGNFLDNMNAKARELKAAAEEQAGKFKAANPNLMAGVNDISTKASEMVKDGQTMVANGVAKGQAMLANDMPNAATVLTKTSLGALNAFVALAKAMYSLMDMINIAKYYTSNPTFALAQLNEKTSEIRTNLLDTYPDIDTCITALQTAIESAPSQPSPPELIPPESFNEKLTRLHNEISTEGVFKTINRDISAINAAMIEMSKKQENQGLIECFNKMKDTVLAAVESKKLLIISGITKLKNANPKTFSAGLKLVNAAKAIGAKMAPGIKRVKAASVQAQAAVGQGIERVQSAIEPASQQAAAAMSSITSGPSQAAKAALDEVKKAAEEYAAKTETALQVAKGEVAKTTKYINDNESNLRKALDPTWQLVKNQYKIRKEFQTQIFNAASNYAYNAATLLDKANAAAAPQLSNEARKAALIELKNAAETNVATTANLLNTAIKLKADSITAKGKGLVITEATEFELNQNMLKSGNHVNEAKANVETVQAIKAKVAAAAAAAGVTI